MPALRSLGYGFGLLQIVWFVWLGIVLLGTTAYPVEPAARRET